MLEKMKFKYSLYDYQKDILDVFEKERKKGDKKIHIVAPPGSGKTIMGLEMISRLEGNHLILVPNITLQYQWKDKINKMFIDSSLNIDDIVSTSTAVIKQINIITYQSLTRSSKNNDIILDQIMDYWFVGMKDDFNDKKDFLNYVDSLKELDLEEYILNIRKYKKKLKNSGEDIISDILSKKVLNYFEELKKKDIKSIIVDEAHHLTSWWSKVIYYLWYELGIYSNKEPFIIGLTATPPYENSDFFLLDDDYSKLLGEVDYYIPTPAIIKSGRLAPYSDLVYFVEPDNSLKKELNRIDILLNKYIKNNKEIILKYIFDLISKRYNYLLGKSDTLLISYLKFLKHYGTFDLNKYYFSEKIGEKITLDDIAKTIGTYTHHLGLQINKQNDVENIKKIFYELGYIWRSRNFYRFRTKLENMLIYGKSKINAVKDILDKEKTNLGEDLKCAIITDFLEEKEAMISCKTILKSLMKYKKLNPILVSGQGIWKLGNKGELEELDTNILEVTNWLTSGKTKLLIGTRGILGEGWDCPKLNTLIDLTGIVAYMSVNQVRGRAIRLDRDNLSKVSNIYDIVTIYDSYSKDVDLSRLKRKHEQFYGVDDTGLIIKGINHIYPNLVEHISDYKNINKNMLKRSEMREYYHKLWSIGGKYENKEVFGLNLEINDIGRYIPFINFRVYDSISFFKLLGDKKTLDKTMKASFYSEIIRRFLNDLLTNIVKSLKKIGDLPDDFKYTLIKGELGNFKLVSSYKDVLIVKKFILDMSTVFKTVTDEKYILNYPFAYLNNGKIEGKFVAFAMPDSLSKNLKIRKIFKKEILNDYLQENLLFNTGKIIDKGIKTPFLGIGGFFAFPSLLTMTSPLLPIAIGILGIITFIKPIFYEKRSKLISDYKSLLYDFRKKSYKFKPKFVYLNNKYIQKDNFIGKKPFIEAKMEKIWI